MYKLPTINLITVRETALKNDSAALDTPLKAVDTIRKLVPPGDREILSAIYLNSNTKPIGHYVVSIGTLSCSLVHPRELFRPAITANAASIIVFHNHPSGETDPSQEDRNATKRIKKAGEILGIPLLDHIIYADGECYSFREHGLI